MSLYFDSVEKLEEHFEDDVLDNLIETEEWGGKHDVTEHSGYYQDALKDWWQVSYSASYNNGVEYIFVTGPLERTVKEVTVQQSVYKKIRIKEINDAIASLPTPRPTDLQPTSR